jgi:hypothetical protein
MSKAYKRLKEYIQLVLGLSVAIAFALLSRDRFIQLYQSNPPIAALSTALALVTFASMVAYWRAVTDELDLLNDAFDDERLGLNHIKGPTLTIGVGLGVMYGIEIAFSTNILLYAAALVVYQLLDIAGQSTVNRNVARMYRTRQFKTQYGEARATVLFDYYLERPLLLRCSGLLFLYFTALALAIAGFFSTDDRFSYAAYALIIVSIPAGELVIYSWRQKRDRALEAIGDADASEKVESL